MPFNPNKPCRTRSGLEVRLWPGRLNATQPLFGVIIGKDGSEYLHQWSENGHFLLSGDNDYDLENIPARSRRWANLYPDPARELPSAALGELQEQQILNPLRLASLEFIFDGQALFEVKIHHNFERVLQDKIPF